MIFANFFILTFYYFLSIFCVLGYGLFIRKLFIDDSIKINYGFTGLIGIFFLIIYSYISHFFLAHNLIHNSIIFLVGLFCYLFFTKSNFKKKEFQLLLIVFFLLLIALYGFKTHDDFPYYHFPYTNFLTKSDIIIGIGNYDHGWRTPSSIFYFNSLFYLPLITHHLFHIGASLIMGFSLVSLSIEAYKKILSNRIDITFYFKLLSLVFILIFFYRISEHGTDRSAQILSFLLVLEILLFIMKQQKFKNFLIKFLTLSSLIVSLKSFYFIYLIFVIPIIHFMYKEKEIYQIKNVLKNSFFYFSIILIFLILFINVMNTGCLIYPLKYSCFENLSWSIPYDEIDKMAVHYESWSKAGSGFKFMVENPEKYISNFNWVSGWTERYFFNKVSDFLLGLILISVIFLFSLRSFKNTSSNKFNFNLIYFCMFVLLFEWFYNHPSLRYGGYSLIGIIFFLITCKFLPNTNVNKKFLGRVSVLILIAVSIFFYRNFDRLVSEYQKYDYNPLINAFYFVDEHHFRVEKDFLFFTDFYKNCTKKKKICDNNSGLIAYKYYGKFIFVRKNRK